MRKDRRDFLAGLGKAGALLAAGSWLRAIGYAQAAAGRRARSSSSRAAAPTSIAACSARFSSISAAPSTPASTSPARRSPTRRASAPTSCARSRSSACRSSAIRAATSSPATTGSTASARRRSGRRCSSGRGTRSRRISSAPTSSSTGAALVGTEPLLGMNFGTGTRGDGGRLRRVLQRRARHEVERPAPRRTATSSRTTCATGAWATRWTGRGRSASCRRASTAARRATPRSRCASSTATLQLIACGSSGTQHADVPRSGIAKCSRSATTRSTAFRCTPTTATRRR